MVFSTARSAQCGITEEAIVKDPLTQKQREALWTWRWLGWRDSTPAFKASLALLAAAGLALAVWAIR